jgi:hypothetical protein
MLRITIELADEAGTEEAEHYCLCLSHQNMLVETFLGAIMKIANGAPMAGFHSALDPGEPKLPPRIPGKCRLCKTHRPMPNGIGICKGCTERIRDEQLEDMQSADFTPPPPPIYDPTLGMRNPPTVGQCAICKKTLAAHEAIFCDACTIGAKHVQAG